MSVDVWDAISHIFPDAIAHMKRRREEEDVDDESCPVCSQERFDKNFTENALRAWHRGTLLACHDLHKRGVSHDNHEMLVGLLKESHPGQKIHLVHDNDIMAWRRALSLTKFKSNHHVDGERTKNLISDALIRGGREACDEFREMVTRNSDNPSKAQKPLLLAMQIALICGNHNQVVEQAVCETPLSDGVPSGIQFNGDIWTLSEMEYASYVESLMKLSTILLDFRSADRSMSLDQVIHLYEFFCHPTLQKGRAGEEENSPHLLFSIKDSYEMVTFGRGICVNELCKIDCKDGIDFKEPQNNMNGVESIDGLASCSPKSRRLSFGANNKDPITLDSDAEEQTDLKEKIVFRIFEVKAGATETDALRILMLPGGIASFGRDSWNAESNVRRSSRKRKSRYPNGCILREESLTMSVESNLAALRLSVFEKCEGFKVNHALILIIPKESVSGAASVPSTEDEDKLKDDAEWIELPHLWDARNLQEILSEVSGISADGSSRPRTHDFIVLRQPKEDSDSHKEVKDGYAEALMDSLLLVAASGTTVDLSKKTSRAPREKGFSGTLLLSGASANINNEDGNEQSKKPKVDSNQVRPPSSSSDQASSGQSTSERKNPEHLPVQKKRDTVDLSDDEQPSSPRIQTKSVSSVARSPSNHAKSPTITDIFCDDDDDDDDINKETPARTSRFWESSRGKRPPKVDKVYLSPNKRLDFKRRRVSTVVNQDDLVEKVVMELLNHSDMTFRDPTKCREAVLNARKANPDEHDARVLLDISLVMMLSDE